MNTVTIQKMVELHPSNLNSIFRETLYKNLCDKYKDTCSIENGYILDIYPDFKILENKISNITENILFDIEFNANVLKPCINDKIECNICMVYNHGIFGAINKLKILVPTSALDEYNFEQNPAKFVHKNIKRKIEKGDKISVILTDIRYNKQNYNCIGKLDE